MTSKKKQEQAASEKQSSLLAFADGLDEVRMLIRSSVAMFKSEGFSDEQAHTLTMAMLMNAFIPHH